MRKKEEEKTNLRLSCECVRVCLSVSVHWYVWHICLQKFVRENPFKVSTCWEEIFREWCHYTRMCSNRLRPLDRVVYLGRYFPNIRGGGVFSNFPEFPYVMARGLSHPPHAWSHPGGHVAVRGPCRPSGGCPSGEEKYSRLTIPHQARKVGLKKSFISHGYADGPY